MWTWSYVIVFTRSYTEPVQSSPQPTSCFKIHFNIIQPSNVEYVVLKFRMLGVLKFEYHTEYLDWDFSWFSSVPSSKCCDGASHSFHVLTTRPAVPRSMGWATDTTPTEVSKMI
jgi:hypothetical protein